MASRNIPHCPVLWPTFTCTCVGGQGKDWPGVTSGGRELLGQRPPLGHMTQSFYLLGALHRVETLFHRMDLTTPWMLMRGDSDAAVVYGDQFIGNVGVFCKENVFKCH